MKHFLVIFDRRAGVILNMQAYDASAEALRARFEYERENPSDDVEVVVLVAQTQEVLQRTHARYFSNMRSLVEDAIKAPLRLPSKSKSMLQARPA